MRTGIRSRASVLDENGGLCRQQCRRRPLQCTPCPGPARHAASPSWLLRVLALHLGALAVPVRTRICPLGPASRWRRRGVRAASAHSSRRPRWQAKVQVQGQYHASRGVTYARPAPARQWVGHCTPGRMAAQRAAATTRLPPPGSERNHACSLPEARSRAKKKAQYAIERLRGLDLHRAAHHTGADERNTAGSTQHGTRKKHRI